MECEPTPQPMVGIQNNSYLCYPCNATCNSKEMLMLHLAGRRHGSKIQLLGMQTFTMPEELGDLPSASEPAGWRKRKNASAQGEFHCEICLIDFGSAIQFEMHMQGKKHNNKAQKRDRSPPQVFKCEICDVSAISQDTYDLHVNGKKHALKVAKMEAAEDKEDIICEVCEVKVPNETHLAIHIKGKKHKAKLERAEAPPETFNCEFCDVTVTNKEIFEQHRNGKKHAERVRRIAEQPQQQRLACELCGVFVTCQALFEAHLAGKKHLKRMVKSEKEPIINDSNRQWSCQVCQFVGATDEDLQAHINGPVHRQRTEEATTPSPKKKKEPPTDPAEAFCGVCNLQLNSPKMMGSHLAGKSHLKKVQLANEENAEMMASTLIQCVREETDADEKRESDDAATAAAVDVMEENGDQSDKEPPPIAAQQQQPLPEQENAALKDVAATVPGTPGRGVRNTRSRNKI